MVTYEKKCVDLLESLSLLTQHKTLSLGSSTEGEEKRGTKTPTTEVLTRFDQLQLKLS